MGAVYVAEQESTGKLRALKVMQSGLISAPKNRERFLLEARVGAKISSDHIVEVVAAGVDGASGMPWLAMELLDGEDLAAMGQRRGRLEASEVLEIFEQLCHALGAAHLASVVHRDLKPENIFIGRSRRASVPFTVKVLDFGIAKILQESRTSATSTAVIGSPLWMAPEQLTARPHRPRGGPLGAGADRVLGAHGPLLLEVRQPGGRLDRGRARREALRRAGARLQRAATSGPVRCPRASTRGSRGPSPATPARASPTPRRCSRPCARAWARSRHAPRGPCSTRPRRPPRPPSRPRSRTPGPRRCIPVRAEVSATVVSTLASAPPTLHSASATPAAPRRAGARWAVLALAVGALGLVGFLRRRALTPEASLPPPAPVVAAPAPAPRTARADRGCDDARGPGLARGGAYAARRASLGRGDRRADRAPRRTQRVRGSIQSGLGRGRGLSLPPRPLRGRHVHPDPAWVQPGLDGPLQPRRCERRGRAGGASLRPHGAPPVRRSLRVVSPDRLRDHLLPIAPPSSSRPQTHQRWRAGQKPAADGLHSLADGPRLLDLRTRVRRLRLRRIGRTPDANTIWPGWLGGVVAVERRVIARGYRGAVTDGRSTLVSRRARWRGAAHG